MGNTTSLRVSEVLNENIVALNSNSTSYVDAAYFKKYLGVSDHSDSKSYEINMVAVEIGWILNSSHGFLFLRRLQDS